MARFIDFFAPSLAFERPFACVAVADARDAFFALDMAARRKRSHALPVEVRRARRVVSRAFLSSAIMADTPSLSITMLGAGQEVGRSCCVLQYRDITIVLDTGVHPAHSGMASLPFIDELDWSTVDAILITQCVYLE